MKITSAGVIEHGALVNGEGQVFTLSEIQTEARHVAEEGDAFFISSGFLTHSNAADATTAMMWFRNDSNTMDIHVGYLRTCNEVAGKWQMFSGVTALDNTPATITPANSNIGSTTTMDATIEASDTAGSAFTGGLAISQWIQNAGHSIQAFDGSLILGPQQSIGITFAPFATASANEACITMQAWQVAG